jgi:predicted nucleic acid-binding protein
MIAADTSAWIDYAKNASTEYTAKVEEALASQRLVVPIPVVFEVLSGPGLTDEARVAIMALPRLKPLPGFWERAAAMRAQLLAMRLKARSMDCLIAQVCIDHEVEIIAADADFRHFKKHGLIIA